MLIVARRKGQRIRIGDHIEVVVSDISGGEVRLGIVAPRQILVAREELLTAVEDANRAAAKSHLDAPPAAAAVVASPGNLSGFSSSSIDTTRS